jgi:cell division septation protein DedD
LTMRPDLSVEPLPPALPPRTPPAAPASPAGPKVGAMPVAPPSDAAASAGSARATQQLIEVATVKDADRARQVQQQLKQAGFDAYWENVRVPDGEIIRVRVAVERSADHIADALASLHRLGFEPTVVGW